MSAALFKDHQFRPTFSYKLNSFLFDGRVFCFKMCGMEKYLLPRIWVRWKHKYIQRLSAFWVVYFLSLFFFNFYSYQVFFTIISLKKVTLFLTKINMNDFTVIWYLVRYLGVGHDCFEAFFEVFWIQMDFLEVLDIWECYYFLKILHIFM